MKNKVSTITVMVVMVIGLCACKKKGCTDSVADNYNSEAAKDDGTCIFPNEKFEGTYFVNETCDVGSDTYTVNVAISGKTDIFITGWIGGNTAMSGSVSGNVITINPASAITDASGYLWDMDLAASGVANGSNFSLSWEMDDILYNYFYGYIDCTAIFSK